VPAKSRNFGVLYYTMAIPNKYNTLDIKKQNVRLNYAVDQLLEIGVTERRLLLIII
jgi:hypothetical protein